MYKTLIFVKSAIKSFFLVSAILVVAVLALMLIMPGDKAVIYRDDAGQELFSIRLTENENGELVYLPTN